jgi:hypothetical protein
VNVDLGAGRDFYQLAVRDTVGTDAVMARLSEMVFGAWLKDGNDRAILDIRTSTLKNVSVDGGDGNEDRLEVLERTPSQFQHANFELISGITTAPVAGWATDTGFRNAETDVQKEIVRQSMAAVGQLSGQSRLFDSNIDRGTPWLTDTDGGDGQRMRNAIGIYHDWFIHSQDHRTVPESVRDRMYVALGAGADSEEGYSATDKDALINRTIEQYNRLAQERGTVSIPDDDNETLQFLGIQKQCIEWNSSIALASGGQARGYNSPDVTVAAPSDYRPGMALLRNNSHAMLITDILWDSAGNPVQFRVVEANAGDDVWSNPIGEIPWDRTVRSFEVSASTSGLRVIRME